MKVKELYHRCKPRKIPCGTQDLPVPETGCGTKPTCAFPNLAAIVNDYILKKTAQAANP